jgi:hypothetical protein
MNPKPTHAANAIIYARAARIALGTRMNRESALLDFYRQTVSKFRTETEKLIASPAKYIDTELSVEPSTGVRLYDRVREIRASFVKDFPQHADRVPLFSGLSNPNGELDRNELRELLVELEKFARLLNDVAR